MTFEFADAAPIETPRTGREKAPNPFENPVNEIARRKNPETGQPLAKQFTLTFEAGEGNRKKAMDKIKRQTSEAGLLVDPPVTVVTRDTDIMKGPKGRQTVSEDSCTVTFWTLDYRQERKRKANEASEDAAE